MTRRAQKKFSHIARDDRQVSCRPSVSVIGSGRQPASEDMGYNLILPLNKYVTFSKSLDLSKLQGLHR